jgi:hypothetical protein
LSLRLLVAALTKSAFEPNLEFPVFVVDPNVERASPLVSNLKESSTNQYQWDSELRKKNERQNNTHWEQDKANKKPNEVAHT